MSLGGILRFIVGHPFNRGRRIGAIGRFLRWQLAQRLLPFPVALPFVDGLRLLVERGMTGATGNFYCGLHEAEDMAFVLHFLRPGDVFYDIGANIGSYSLLAAAAGVGQIVGFEPSLETSRRYQRNIALNALGDRVSIHRLALGDRVGGVSFTQGADTTNHVVASGEAVESVETVSMRCFDEFYARGQPSFIKLDVEGFEPMVLAGAREALKDPALMGLLVEDNGSDRRYSAECPASELIRAAGFSVFHYDPLKRQLVPGPGRATGNLLFLRQGQDAAERVRSAPRFRLVSGWV